VFSDTYGFAIDTDNTLLNVKDSLKTYTFKVLRPQQNPDILENLVVSIDTIVNTTQQLLISYPKLVDSYDFQYMTVTELSEHIAIPSRTFGCYEIWYYEDPVTTDYACASGNHTGEAEASSCDYQGTDDAPYSITSGGGWVSVQECTNGSDQIIYGDCTGCNSNTGGIGGGGSGLNTLPFDPVDVKTLQFNAFVENNLTADQQAQGKLILCLVEF